MTSAMLVVPVVLATFCVTVGEDYGQNISRVVLLVLSQVIVS
jgi:hypothetical protein